MKSKFVIIGALIGILVGTILAFLFPSLLNFGLIFNQISNKSLGYPSNSYLVTEGSIYNAYPNIALFFGLIGGVIGFIAFKVVRKKF